MNIYYTIYETTCLINGKKYRGVHKTSNPHDKYLGSGTMFLHAVELHGRENFIKEIIFMAFSIESMYEMEKQFVSEEWANSPNTYNIKQGGMGGCVISEETKRKISKKLIGIPKPKGFAERVSDTKRKNPIPSRPKGCKNSPEHVKRISEGKKGKPSHMSTCPHCNKTGGTGAMSRHHFDHCKSRE